MNEQQVKSISKFMSLVLRHQPETIGITLDENGWTDVQELLTRMNQHRQPITLPLLQEVVATNDKKRFSFSEDGTKIRASQGHSVEVSLGLDPVTPPEYLYHGTVARFLDSIKQDGLQKMSRQHLHLSKDRQTAVNVGSRRGAPYILTIRTSQMHRDGFLFYLSDNGVWLTDHVPAIYIEF